MPLEGEQNYFIEELKNYTDTPKLKSLCQRLVGE